MHCVNLSSAIRLYRGHVCEVFAHPYKYEPQPKFRYTRSFNRTLALVKTARQTVVDYGVPTLILTRKHNCIDIVKFILIASNLPIRTTSIMKYAFAPEEFGTLDIGIRDLQQPSIGEKMWIWEVDEIDECAVKAFVKENGIRAVFFNDLDVEPKKKRLRKEEDSDHTTSIEFVGQAFGSSYNELIECGKPKILKQLTNACPCCGFTLRPVIWSEITPEILKLKKERKIFIGEELYGKDDTDYKKKYNFGFVQEYTRPQYACGNCGESFILQS